MVISTLLSGLESPCSGSGRGNLLLAQVSEVQTAKVRVCVGSHQAREDIIVLLKSDRTGADTLEAHYGSSVPIKPLQALQRDGLLTAGPQSQDVYQGPMAEVSSVEQSRVRR